MQVRRSARPCQDGISAAGGNPLVRGRAGLALRPDQDRRAKGQTAAAIASSRAGNGRRSRRAQASGGGRAQVRGPGRKASFLADDDGHTGLVGTADRRGRAGPLSRLHAQLEPCSEPRHREGTLPPACRRRPWLPADPYTRPQATGQACPKRVQSVSKACPGLPGAPNFRHNATGRRDRWASPPQVGGRGVSKACPRRVRGFPFPLSSPGA